MIDVVHVCSFREATGRCKVDGVWWQWEFHHYLGPTFTDKHGEMIDFPEYGHPVWVRFEVWFQRYQRSRGRDKTCC